MIVRPDAAPSALLMRAVMRNTALPPMSVPWLTLVMVLLISGNTLSRYFFNASTVWLQELEWHLLAVVALWGISHMQLRGSQVRVDLFYQHYSARTKLWIEFLTAVLVMLPFSLFVCFLGWKFAAYSWSLAEISPDPGGLAWRWAVKSLVVSGYALLAITAVSIIVRSGAQLAGRAPVLETPGETNGT